MLPDPLDDYARLAQRYIDLIARYHATPLVMERDVTDKENQTQGGWHDEHYVFVGRDAARLIVGALLSSGRDVPETVLDFPSGSGRVTRHLRALFPDARIGACDLYREHVDFCAEHFGAEPILSTEHLDQLKIAPEWDVVFCGSLLTHLPEHLFWPTIRFIERALSPRGIALVTLEGRRSEYIQDHHYRLLEPEPFERIRKRYHRSGFGFADYGGATRKLFDRQASYGVALVKPSWVLAGIEQMPGVRVLGYFERAWDDHQDVVVFGRPGAAGD